MCPGESKQRAARSPKKVHAAVLKREQPLDGREFWRIRIPRILCLEDMVGRWT